MVLESEAEGYVMLGTDVQWNCASQKTNDIKLGPKCFTSYEHLYGQSNVKCT